MRDEAQAVVADLLEAYASADAAGREALRGLVPRRRSFFWAGQPPRLENEAAALRLSLLHVALEDQHPDSHDALLEIGRLAERFQGLPVGVRDAIWRDVAALASDIARYGLDARDAAAARLGRVSAPYLRRSPRTPR